MASATLIFRIVGGFSAEVICECEAEPHWTVHELKVKLEHNIGTPWDSQRLLLEGRVLGNSEQLSEVSKGSCPQDLALVRLDPRKGKAVRNLQEHKVEFENIDEDLRNDREVLLAALKVDGHALQYASEELQRDTTIVYAALRETAFALQHVPEDLRRNPEVVLFAVQKNGLALQHADHRLQSDPELVFTALCERATSLTHHQEELRGVIKCIVSKARVLMDDRKFALSAVRAVPPVFEFVSSRLTADEELAFIAVKNNPAMMCFVATELQSQKQFVLAAVQANARCLPFVDAHFKMDKDIIRSVQKNPEVILRPIFRQT